MSPTTSNARRTYYDLLGLSSDAINQETALTPTVLKTAYRRALLQHHPDKAGTTLSTSDFSRHNTTDDRSRNNLPNPTSKDRVSIDDLLLAYKTLSSPTKRAEYDSFLRRQRARRIEDGSEAAEFPTGLETVDLDDLEYEETESCWRRGCRCGNSEGFVVREEQLEREAKEGEVVVGCAGCSLWLRVLFGVEEEEG